MIMTKKDQSRKKNPVVRIDNSLERYKDEPLFQEKVDKANRVLKNVKLPKQKRVYSKVN